MTRANRILLATAHQESNSQITKALESEGFRVSGVSNGTEVIRAFESDNELQVAILDERIKGVSIPTLGHDIREVSKEAGRLCYIILLTDARKNASGLITALKAGVDDFLAIPFTPSTLVARVQVGLGLLDGLEKGEHLKHANEITDMLVAEHPLLRDIRDLMTLVNENLDRGIPKDVLSWCVSVVFMADYEVHVAKERIYTDKFIERVVTEHPDWFAEMSKTSFAILQEQHDELEAIFKDMKNDLEKYLEDKMKLLEPVTQSVQAYDIGLQIGDRDDEMEKCLADIYRDLGNYYAERKRLTAPLKKTISRYIEIIGPHFKLEEETFFPFSCKYLTEEDIHYLKSMYAKIDVKAGRGRIEAEARKVRSLLKTMKKVNADG
ncbi:MAG: response regulator [Methanobacteriota archaeon]